VGKNQIAADKILMNLWGLLLQASKHTRASKC